MMMKKNPKLFRITGILILLFIGQQVIERNVGFRNIEWTSFQGASVESDLWISNVNDREIFLQGVNWSPIRNNLADLRENDYRKLIKTYKNLGVCRDVHGP